MPSFTKTIITITALTSLALAAPFTLSTSQRLKPRQSTDPAPMCINGRTKLYTPTLYNIYNYPNTTPFPSTSNTLNVMAGSSSSSSQDQIALWSNLPNNLQGCAIGWHQAEERSFSVYDNGLLRFQQMTGLPGSNITRANIGPFENEGGKGGSMDFTYWPEISGAASHTGGAVDCGSEVVVKLTKDVENGGNGSVTLEQGVGNGLFLSFDC